jgi:hypothetical protein
MSRFIINLLWQFALPGLVLLFFAYRDRSDGKPDYVVPWLLFAAIIGAAWTMPIATQSRIARSPSPCRCGSGPGWRSPASVASPVSRLVLAAALAAAAALALHIGAWFAAAIIMAKDLHPPRLQSAVVLALSALLLRVAWWRSAGVQHDMDLLLGGLLRDQRGGVAGVAHATLSVPGIDRPRNRARDVLGSRCGSFDGPNLAAAVTGRRVRVASVARLRGTRPTAGA